MTTHPGGPVNPSPSLGRAPDRLKPKGRLGHPRIMRAASDDDTMLDAERKASPFCAGRAIVVNEREESAGPDVCVSAPDAERQDRAKNGRTSTANSLGAKLTTCRHRSA